MKPLDMIILLIVAVLLVLAWLISPVGLPWVAGTVRTAAAAAVRKTSNGRRSRRIAKYAAPVL